MIGVVVVSHSAALAQGVVELARQMAPDVAVAAAGGTEDGDIGTSLDLVNAALEQADGGDGAVVLTDLGSATMTAEMALEMLEDAQRARIVLVDAPLVEGAIAAATAAAGGADLAAVRAAAEGGGAAPRPEPASAVREVTLRNPLGLHARPASAVVRSLKGLKAQLRLTRADTGASADGRSVLAIVNLAATGGTVLRLEASGPDAERALSAVERLVAEGFGEAFVEEETAAPAAAAPGEMAGLPAAPGVAAGPAARLRPPEISLPATSPVTRDALARAREQVAEALRTTPGGIFAAQLDLLEDPELDAAVTEAIESGRDAARAWSDAIEAQRARIAALDQPVFAARAADVADVGRRVLAALAGATDEAASVPRGAIALADDVLPSQVPALADAGAAGLALSGGAPGSHAAVLARGAGLPLVVGLGPALAEVAEGALVLLDGDRGTLRLHPPDEAVRDAGRVRAVDPAAREPVRTRDGTALRVGANVASRAEAERAVAMGADEFGLVRTELAFLDRPTLPSEDEQADRLAGICEAAGGRPVVVRTLDVGGDKVAPALDLDPIRNGFLGQRGLRWSLAHPEVFGAQLRAILRAAAGHRVRLMFPMVTTVSEVREAQAALDDARRQLDESGSAHGDVEEVGIMVEVPAAAVAAESLAAEVDFFSIGSNDLLSYLMAADRTLGAVAGLRDPRHPAFLRLVSDVCAAARTAGIWVGVCGDTAGDPELAVLLARLGVTELSMAPPAIPSVKARLRAADLTERGPG